MEERIEALEHECQELREQVEKNSEYIKLLLDACNSLVDTIHQKEDRRGK